MRSREHDRRGRYESAEHSVATRGTTPGRCPQQGEPGRPNHSQRVCGRQPMTASPRRLTAGDVMTGREVAVLLHAPVSTVEDWARRNIIPSVKIGRRRLYIRQSIEAALIGSAPTG
jgi:excisionase family DNA binding protein